MEIDRHYQRQLLEELNGIYPDSKDCAYQRENQEQRRQYENFFYLREHGLVEGNETVMPDGNILYSMRATNRGIDFIEDDGGLSAILGVITVKLHEDTIRYMLEMRIKESDLPEKEKTHWLESIKKLPYDVLKHLTLKLLETGLDQFSLQDLLTGISQ